MRNIARRLDALERATGTTGIVPGPCPACGADDHRPRVVCTDPIEPPVPTPADLAPCPRCRREPMHVVFLYTTPDGGVWRP